MVRCVRRRFCIAFGFLVVTFLLMNAFLNSSKPIRDEIRSDARLPSSKEREEEAYRAISNRSVSRLSYPDFLVIGARKCGTRALLTMLHLHPQISVSGPEIHFFDLDENYERGVDWYLRQLPARRPGQLVGEKTPAYFVAIHVPERIRKFEKEAGKRIKLILTIREPVTRVISDLTQSVAQMNWDVEADSNRINNFVKEKAFHPLSGKITDEQWQAIGVSQYAYHLEKWWKEFPKSQIHIVNGDRLITNPLSEMIQVSHYLNLSPFDWESSFYFNKTRGFYCLQRYIRDFSSTKCLGDTKGRPHPKIEEKIYYQLLEYYKPWNKKLTEMTGIDFGWAI